MGASKTHAAKQALQNGQGLALSMIPVIKTVTSSMTQEEKIVWWAGLMASLAGCAVAEIGHEAIQAVADAAESAAATCLAKNSH